jgi:predicted nucleic acid-binding protein
VKSFYLDASALAKRYSPEIGSALIDRLFATAAHDRFLLLNIGIGRSSRFCPKAKLRKAVAERFRLGRNGGGP